MSSLITTVLKLTNNANLDGEWYLELLAKHNPNEWFIATNANGNDYDICRWFHENGFIAQKTVPCWNGDSFRGYKRYFLYNHEMDYLNTPY